MNDNAAAFVHEYNGRWIVAEYRNGRYTAPHTAAAYKLTGCYASYGPLSYIFGGNVYHYARRADALRRVRQTWGCECLGCRRAFLPFGNEIYCPACEAQQKGK